MKSIEKFINEQLELYKKNFNSTGAWWWGFRDAMESVQNYITKRREKNVERNSKRRIP